MSRRKKRENRNIQPDTVYNNVMVSILMNHIMERGKKNTARKIVYGAFDIIKKTNQDPLDIFNKAIQNTSPLLEIKPKRIGGATYQVPTEVRGDRKTTLSMRWIINAARSKKGKPMKSKLAEELMLAAKNEGSAIKKRDDVHRMAEANRAFAHFAW
ncbi:MAG: 30S ribosomal protein S7 [Candidatus Nealsonbacteria bacterium]|nr:30S ribosomal protein S7 [Candidatus Nealsonbacteria bacterium]